ncbi:beta-galactosidase [Cellulomonas shaoxiangyii]|uniref:Beta-galactosidase n=1 Tax=Cellulomonas shaoxiangyii TaxID=2566013 RepID=A0A4P7SFC6_9CELL|nr:beta-galactosidase [Cellulomonas shaoxiangyii]QCB92590.1 beta-galactosidase [Cellulomonas shaoxiangyii]TGY85254.1 beta-galactosidase [Cellulomonas shaoxiangyii]
MTPDGPGLPLSDHLRYGGDYNPEQWPEHVWDADHAAFTAARISTLTVGVFAWAHLQPAEDRYDFSRLDAIVSRVAAEGRQVVLATPSGAMPPWLARAYPEACRVDFEGHEKRYGGRHNHCPSSPAFRRLSVAMADRLAERYADHPAVVAWHVGNEYGGACYCDRCAAGFRVWLRGRYGTLDRLNAAWSTVFWSHLYGDWEEVVPPNALSEHWRGPNHTAFHGATLDYRRFMSDALLGGFVAEKAAIRAHDAATPVTTNLMGFFQPVDYHRWAPHLDFASWDNYPPADDPLRTAARMAATHAAMRGLKGGQPFWVMEQTPSTTASRDVNPVKRPGVLALWTWQSVAHGADATLYFQMRQSRGACEKYHGAVLDHSGRTDTRVFREVTELGGALAVTGDALLGARTPARVALLLDWDSWWAVEMTDGYNRHVGYLATFLRYHRALWHANVPVDVVPVTADLSGYDVVVAPLLHMLKGDVADRLGAHVERGGSLVTTFYGGRVDEDTSAFLGEPPLDALLGVRVEETDSAVPGAANPVTLHLPGGDVVHAAELVFELLVPHPGTEVVGTYGADFYAGTPAVTRATRGEGQAWHVGTGLDDDGVAAVLRAVLDRHGLVGPHAADAGVEVADRLAPDGTCYRFLLHHGDGLRTITLEVGGTDLLTGREVAVGEELTLAPAQVMVLRQGTAC